LSRIHGVQQKSGGKTAIKDSKAGLCDKKHNFFERVFGLVEKMIDFCTCFLLILKKLFLLITALNLAFITQMPKSFSLQIKK